MNTKFSNPAVVSFLLMACLLGGCETLSGGPCSYEPFAGTADVISINEGGYKMKFMLLPEPVVKSHASTFLPPDYLNGLEFVENIRNPKMVGATVGSRYFTQAFVITGGTCTLVNFLIGLQDIANTK